MNEKLQNIFVSLEVAKMAKHKGFNEWCAAYYHGANGDISPLTFEDNFDIENSLFSSVQFPAPTHYQLIEWLLDKHEIDVWYGFSEWSVYRSGDQSAIGYAETINEALLLALNQLPDKP